MSEAVSPPELSSYESHKCPLPHFCISLSQKPKGPKESWVNNTRASSRDQSTRCCLTHLCRADLPHPFSLHCLWGPKDRGAMAFKFLHALGFMIPLSLGCHICKVGCHVSKDSQEDEIQQKEYFPKVSLKRYLIPFIPMAVSQYYTQQKKVTGLSRNCYTGHSRNCYTVSKGVKHLEDTEIKMSLKKCFPCRKRYQTTHK